MTEIKFRAWDSLCERWEYLPDTGNIELMQLDDISFGLDCDKEAMVIEQFIGLRDKNGVEIYEGDIIKTLAGIIGGVKFICGCFCIYEVNTNNYHLLYIFECKVVGNIHENPELLEK